MKKIALTVAICAALFAACRFSRPINITPHPVNGEADRFYQQAVTLAESSYNLDSARKCMRLLDQAIAIDSLNPDYYGMKARLLAETGRIDEALTIQLRADSIGAINGEYLFQLGLFQAVKGKKEAAAISFERSSDYLNAVLKRFPDSLGAFILQQAAYSLYKGEDSLYMSDIVAIRKRFPNRLSEVEMSRRFKPYALISKIKMIEKQMLEDDISLILNNLNDSIESLQN